MPDPTPAVTTVATTPSPATDTAPAGATTLVGTVMSTVKPGWKTTEFYLAGAAGLISMVYALGWISPTGTGELAHGIALAAAALASLGYSISRGNAKSG